MKAAQGILTVRGGMTSHAAVVARGMGTCCVSGCGAIVMDEENKQFTAGRQDLPRGRLALHGRLHRQDLRRAPSPRWTPPSAASSAASWAGPTSTARLQVRTNADTPHDAAQARKFGAQGIGLCRTEHMFFDEDRIPAIREMIVLRHRGAAREGPWPSWSPMQQSDFEGIYEAMEGCPVTIRFLDPPLHEFVPTEEADIEELANDMGKISVAEHQGYHRQPA